MYPDKINFMLRGPLVAGTWRVLRKHMEGHQIYRVPATVLYKPVFTKLKIFACPFRDLGLIGVPTPLSEESVNSKVVESIITKICYKLKTAMSLRRRCGSELIKRFSFFA
jgi:hypothetical protein